MLFGESALPAFEHILGLVIWMVILLIKDPKGVVKKAILGKR